MSSKQICPRCGSTHLNYEAIVSWSAGREAFEIEHVDNPISCRDCEFEIVTTETLEKKKGLVGDLIHLYINSLTLDELKNQLVENLAGDCEDDQHDYLVDLVEEKFGESVESLHKRTNGGRK